MVRKEIMDISRQVATEVYNQLGTQFGVPANPYHIHNGTDAPILPALSVSAFAPLGEVVSNAIKTGQTVNNINPLNFNGSQTVPTLILPVIYGNESVPGTTDGFLGGSAVEGEIVLFVTPSLIWEFWTYLDGGWHGVELPLVVSGIGTSASVYFNVATPTIGTSAVSVFGPGGLSAPITITGIYIISSDTTAGNITVENPASTVVATIAKGTIAGAMIGATILSNTFVNIGTNLIVKSSSTGNATVFITYII